MQIEEEPKEPADEGEKFGLPEVKMRTEAERRDYVKEKLEKYKEFQVSEVISQTMETLSALPISELQKLNEDDQYNEDFRMTTPSYMSMCRKKDITEDKAQKMAKENIEEAEKLEEVQQIYTETILPNYED